MTINHYWYSSSSRMFFQSACDVPEPEEKFNVDEYSDMVTLSKPIIYISIEEIINTHSVNPSTVTLTFRPDFNLPQCVIQDS